MRYYFDTFSRGVHHRDDEGMDLADRDAARRIADKSVHEMVGDRGGDDELVQCCVRSEDGDIVYSASMKFEGRWA